MKTSNQNSTINSEALESSEVPASNASRRGNRAKRIAGVKPPTISSKMTSLKKDGIIAIVPSMSFFDCLFNILKELPKRELQAKISELSDEQLEEAIESLAKGSEAIWWLQINFINNKMQRVKSAQKGRGHKDEKGVGITKSYEKVGELTGMGERWARVLDNIGKMFGEDLAVDSKTSKSPTKQKNSETVSLFTIAGINGDDECDPITGSGQAADAVENVTAQDSSSEILTPGNTLAPVNTSFACMKLGAYNFKPLPGLTITHYVHACKLKETPEKARKLLAHASQQILLGQKFPPARVKAEVQKILKKNHATKLLSIQGENAELVHAFPSRLAAMKLAQITVKMKLTSLGSALEESINFTHSNLGLKIKEEVQGLLNYDTILPEKDYKRRDSQGAGVFSEESFIELVKETLKEDETSTPFDKAAKSFVEEFYKDLEEKIKASKGMRGFNANKYYRGKS